MKCYAEQLKTGEWCVYNDDTDELVTMFINEDGERDAKRLVELYNNEVEIP